MKILRLLPLTFLSGIDGFELFAAYAVAVLLAARLVRLSRSWRAVAKSGAPAPVVHADPDESGIFASLAD